MKGNATGRSIPRTWVLDELAASIRDTHADYADAMVFAAHTGLRAGELIALQPQDVRHLPYAHIVVTSAWSEEAHREEATESGKARHVPLDPVAAEVITR